MTKTEIKKTLYKQKPTAIFVMIRLGVAYYQTTLEDSTIINFEVPVEDMGSADFESEMDAKLLNRWITN